jgi:hypothetical protein
MDLADRTARMACGCLACLPFPKSRAKGWCSCSRVYRGIYAYRGAADKGIGYVLIYPPGPGGAHEHRQFG